MAAVASHSSSAMKAAVYRRVFCSASKRYCHEPLPCRSSTRARLISIDGAPARLSSVDGGACELIPASELARCSACCMRTTFWKRLRPVGASLASPSSTLADIGRRQHTSGPNGRVFT